MKINCHRQQVNNSSQLCELVLQEREENRCSEENKCCKWEDITGVTLKIWRTGELAKHCKYGLKRSSTPHQLRRPQSIKCLSLKQQRHHLECSLECSQECSQVCSLNCYLKCSLECSLVCSLKRCLECSLKYSLGRSLDCSLECSHSAFKLYDHSLLITHQSSLSSQEP